MKIEDLPLNDTFVQYMRSLRLALNKEAKEKLEKRMKKCNHLFVKLKEGVTIPGYHTTDYYYEPCEVECVYCGLTNKFESLEHSIIGQYNMWSMHKTSVHTKTFEDVFKKAYTRGGKSFNESVFNLISKEVLNTYHPKLLYDLASNIKSDASEEEIFETMKELNLLETEQERLRLRTTLQANDLVNRYLLTYNRKLSLKK